MNYMNFPSIKNLQIASLCDFYREFRAKRTEIPKSPEFSGGPGEAALLGTVGLDAYKNSKLVPQGITHFLLINIQCSKVLEF